MSTPKKTVSKKAAKATKTAKTNKPAATVRPAASPAAPHRHPKPGLGRGLGALISHIPAVTPPPTTAAPLATTMTPPAHATSGATASATPTAAVPADAQSQQWVLEIPVGEIMRSPWQPRQTFDEEALRELAESIKANGVIQPLICRKNAEGRY